MLALRALPGIDVWRPADANETIIAWQESLKRSDGPSALVLTRQGLPILPGGPIEGARKGGYVLRDTTGAPDVVLIGTGSEVSACVAAADILEQGGCGVRVVSMPNRERF